MKNITDKLIALLKQGYCIPQISRIAKKIHEPATTIHYNLKKLEKEGKIKAYKAVFNYKNIDEGYCTYLLINLREEDYGNQEIVAEQFAKNPNIESVDVCTGEHELLVKVRFKDVDEYYAYVKQIVKKYNLRKVVSLTSLKQIKTEFVKL